MAVQWSDALRNAILDAWETYLNTGGTPIINIYDGTPPATESDALSSNNILAQFTAADWAAAGATTQGVKLLAATLTDATANNSGLASFYRIMTGTQGGASTTGAEQGLVGQNWAASTAYLLNQHVINDSSKVYKCTTAGTSAGSGGPTGTAGSGITDGTAVWGYVGTADMTIDNGNINAGQQVQITAFGKTAPG